MTASAIRQSLEARFSTKWAAATPIAWENVDYQSTPGTSYVAFRIVPNGSGFASLGMHPLVRSLGLITVDIYTPINGGTEPGNLLADDVIAAFRDTSGRAWQDGGLRCRAGGLVSSMKEEEWYRHVVIVEYEYDESF
jgi:hypothetical protein